MHCKNPRCHHHTVSPGGRNMPRPCLCCGQQTGLTRDLGPRALAQPVCSRFCAGELHSGRQHVGQEREEVRRQLAQELDTLRNQEPDLANRVQALRQFASNAETAYRNAEMAATNAEMAYRNAQAQATGSLVVANRSRYAYIEAASELERLRSAILHLRQRLGRWDDEDDGPRKRRAASPMAF